MASHRGKIIFGLNLLLFAFVYGHGGHFDYFASEISARMPSPPSTALVSFPKSRQDIGAGIGGDGVIPPPQNNPVNPLGPPPPGPGLGNNGLPDGLVPFGLNHIILIVIPKFMAKFHMLPDWLHSTIKISMPITVFFDQLTVPPGMFLPYPGIFGEPIPLPIGAVPPIGFRPPFPPPPVLPGGSPPPPGPAVPPPQAGMVSSPQSQTSSVYDHYPPYQTSYPSSYSTGGYDIDPEEFDDGEEDGYDNYYPEEEKRRKRWKRKSFTNSTTDAPIKSRQKRAAVVFNDTIYAAERAALIPRLVDLLENGGYGGKSCLLRTICEVHEAPLTHYGLLGELFTMFFSVSRSVFAESHLPEYLHAEEMGKSGDCSEYFKHCDHSIFSWEEVNPTKRRKNKKKAPFVFNVIDEVF